MEEPGLNALLLNLEDDTILQDIQYNAIERGPDCFSLNFSGREISWDPSNYFSVRFAIDDENELEILWDHDNNYYYDNGTDHTNLTKETLLELSRLKKINYISLSMSTGDQTVFSRGELLDVYELCQYHSTQFYVMFADGTESEISLDLIQNLADPVTRIVNFSFFGPPAFFSTGGYIFR